MTRLAFILATTIAVNAGTSRPKPTHAAMQGAHDGGVLHGKIVAINYLQGRMLLREARNRTIDVYVLPSTNIVGRAAGYHTIGDLKKGTTVEVLTSVQGKHTNAEIIKLR